MTTSTMIAAGKETLATISDLRTVLAQTKDRSLNSLSSFTKRVFLNSRVYIEDIISGEAVIPGLMKLLNSVYTSMVIVALKLDTLVSSGQSVRQMMTAVSTEQYNEIVDVIKDQFGDKNVTEKEIASFEDNGDKGGKALGDTKEFEVKTDASKLFTGRLMEVTLGTGDQKVNIYFLVQLVPYILPGVVMEEFLTNAATPSARLRWAQVKAGEIRFWKDFIFECDQVAKRAKALKVDKDGILREVEDHRKHGLWESIKNFIRPAGDPIRRNVANSIVIVSKTKLDKICRDLGYNIKNFKDRQKIMNSALALILVAYDPNYGTVDLYLDGIQNRGEYTDQMVQSFVKSENSDKADIKQLLTLIAAGNAPRF